MSDEKKIEKKEVSVTEKVMGAWKSEFRGIGDKARELRSKVSKAVAADDEKDPGVTRLRGGLLLLCDRVAELAAGVGDMITVVATMIPEVVPAVTFGYEDLRRAAESMTAAQREEFVALLRDGIAEVLVPARPDGNNGKTSATAETGRGSVEEAVADLTREVREVEKRSGTEGPRTESPTSDGGEVHLPEIPPRVASQESGTRSSDSRPTGS